MKSFIAALLCLMPTIAVAQQHPCGPLDASIKNLGEHLNMLPVMAGAVPEVDADALLLINPESGAFVILLTKEDRACLVVTGQNWHVLPPTKTKPEDPPS